MMRLIVFTLTLAFLLSGASGRAADAPDPGTARPGWKLVFQDEFNGKTADLDANWEFQNAAQGHILCSRWRENVILENGLCRILNKKESRGGQAWTSGAMWTKKDFKFGYFECRYRYGDAPGLNNSFWLMTRGDRKTEQGLFEIDINEGHFPNEVNTNVHKWSGKHEARWRAFNIGARPDYNFVLEAPVEVQKIRLIVRDEEKARIQELRVFAPAAKYPPIVLAAPKAAKGKKAAPQPATQAVNLALGAKAVANSAMADYPAEKAVDGALGNDSRWVSENPNGPHTLIIDLGKKQPVGCLQLVTGWLNGGKYTGLATDFSIEGWNGEKWVEMARGMGGEAQLANEFHVYGLEWSEKELVFYFDGKVLRRMPNEWCHRAAPVWLSEAIIKWGGEISDKIDGTTMDVDYVRVYERAGGSEAKPADDLNLNAMLREAPGFAKFVDPNYYIWCGSMVRDDMGRCHLFYSRWPRKLGHYAWVTHSEVAHAVAESPLGPYRHVDVALPARGAQFWDGLCTHNPTVHNFGGKYYIYYMGDTGDGKAMKTLNWTHRNNQRIGVAVADSPNGPWKRFDKPVIDISPDKNAPDALMVSNPAVTRRPDGSFLMIYKCAATKNPAPQGGPVVHCIATAKNPEGPFEKTGRLAFTVPGDNFPAEDPYIWWQADRSRYYAVVKDMRGAFTKAGKSLALFTSEDGLDWRPAAHPLVSTTQIPWTGGRIQKVNSLERPQLWFDDDGRPAALFAASDEDKQREHSFNVVIPLAME